MSGLLSVGTRALQANQVALQTAGNNIANVNTPGYSRQTVVLQTMQGQFTGSGYIGKGVEVQTIERNFSAFLTRQSALAGTAAAADNTRVDKIKQLEGIFEGGSSGLGAAVSDMLNAFSDVASAPTDLTARTVVLTRVDETAARMRSTSLRLDDLQQGVTQELSQKVSAINSLTQNIASINEKIARTKGSGQPPNDLLDQRDQMVRDLNQYIQTTSIAAEDGTVGIFIGGSQALVLGNTAAPVALVNDEFGQLKNKLAITRDGQTTTLDENTLGGGEVSGLLRFQNTELAEGRNLLGRLTLAVTTSMNDQHKLGLDMNGNAGGNLFTPMVFGASNVMEPTGQASAASLSLSISDASKFAASDYAITFSVPATTPASGTITRQSDKLITSFTLPVAPAAQAITIDGLKISLTGTPGSGDRFLIKPFSTSASNISSAFSNPKSLAVASPVAASTGSSNKGTLSIPNLAARSVPAPAAVTLAFTGPGTYTRSDTGATSYAFTPGQTIEFDLVSPGATGWSLTLKGTPQAGDTVTVLPQPTANRNLNAGNASAMMDLRDKTLFDGAALTDGYAGLISQVGIRAQSATYAADISGSIASNLEKERTGVSGVNLDEEAAKLLQYQQAYQASAKMIQIAQSIFDTLIQTLGR